MFSSEICKKKSKLIYIDDFGKSKNYCNSII